MARVYILLLFVLVAVALHAAPAPFVMRRDLTWNRGWDKPVDFHGDCTFDRAGDKLTIAIPETQHRLNVTEGKLEAPLLLRSAKGDFAMQVRVGADWREISEDSMRWAGLIVTDGARFLRLVRSNEFDPPGGWVIAEDLRGNIPFAVIFKGLPRHSRAYLRLERKQGVFAPQYSADGKTWTNAESWGPHSDCLADVRLPESVKVGVYAESWTPGKWKVEFDRFHLTVPDK